ncbi:MAG TPA: hypothetical protein VN841_22205 [Bryobacteraceae bacterium]|nr:hypothetical protein [Bryobacteraceae bacterium]
MTTRFPIPARWLCAALLTTIPMAAQPGKPPDLSGLWDGARPTGDLARALPAGQKIPFTPYGLEKYKNVDLATNPNGQCLPPGPSRSITGPSPFQIVQNKDTVAFLFENHFDYRIIYIDGQHPADINDYPAFMGHSIGKWEGDTLVVDTVSINDRTWLDSNGLQHSDKLHLTERFRPTGPDTIHYAVTFDDPVFFTKPWTFDLDLKRQKKGDRIMEYVCEENEKDFKTLKPTTRKVEVQ